MSLPLEPLPVGTTAVVPQGHLCWAVGAHALLFFEIRSYSREPLAPAFPTKHGHTQPAALAL